MVVKTKKEYRRDASERNKKLYEINKDDPNLYKKCSLCKKEKQAKNFYRSTWHKHGLSSYCKTCKAIEGKKYYSKPEVKKEIYKNCKENRAKRRQWFFDTVGAYCRKCGYNKTTYALQAHHNDMSKKENIFDTASIWILGHGMKYLKEKMENTDLTILCANCHMELHGEIRNGK